MHMTNKEIGAAMTIKLDPVLPEYPVFKEGIRRAPMRDLTLSDHEKKLAVKNALRYGNGLLYNRINLCIILLHIVLRKLEEFTFSFLHQFITSTPSSYAIVSMSPA